MSQASGKGQRERERVLSSHCHSLRGEYTFFHHPGNDSLRREQLFHEHAESVSIAIVKEKRKKESVAITRSTESWRDDWWVWSHFSTVASHTNEKEKCPPLPYCVYFFPRFCVFEQSTFCAASKIHCALHWLSSFFCELTSFLFSFAHSLHLTVNGAVK